MEVNMLIGMFSTKIYELSLRDDSLVLEGEDANRIIYFSDISALSIIHPTRRASRMELAIGEEILEIVIKQKTDADALIEKLKDTLNTKMRIDFQLKSSD